MYWSDQEETISRLLISKNVLNSPIQELQEIIQSKQELVRLICIIITGSHHRHGSHPHTKSLSIPNNI